MKSSIDNVLGAELHWDEIVPLDQVGFLSQHQVLDHLLQNIARRLGEPQ